MVGECARHSFALRVLGDAGANLKLETFAVKSNQVNDNNAVLQLVVNSER
jgi:hypothetical protein